MRQFLVFSTAALLLVACDSATEGGHGHHPVEFHMGLGPGPGGVVLAAPAEHEADEHGEADAHGEADEHAPPVEGEHAAAAGVEAEAEVAEAPEAEDPEGPEAEDPEAELAEAPEADESEAEAEDAPAEPEPEPAPAPADAVANATVKLGSNKVADGLDAGAVRKSVRKQKGGIEACYIDALGTNPALAGKVTVEFYVEKKGDVSGAKIKSSSHGDAKLDACILAKIEGWSFASPEGGDKAKVRYIFDLSAGS